ncbi:MAG: hypothetical protein LM568_00365 [Desulfurococcaceae archaeon]|nr:hypothetical protein [Desulfurococcaceae archaeon]
MLIVLKVSGHLYRYRDKVVELMQILEDLVEKEFLVVVVPGGSIFADTVKEFQVETGIDDDLAHWMAIKAMEIYGLYLAKYSRKAVETYTLRDIENALKEKLIPIAMPYRILKEHDELPHSWDISSDSIATYIASLVRADIVVFGKLIKGILNENRVLIHKVKVDEGFKYIRNEFDKYVIHLLKKFRIPLAIFDVTNPSLLYKIVKQEYGNYTLLLP